MSGVDAKKMKMTGRCVRLVGMSHCLMRSKAMSKRVQGLKTSQQREPDIHTYRKFICYAKTANPIVRRKSSKNVARVDK